MQQLLFDKFYVLSYFQCFVGVFHCTNYKNVVIHLPNHRGLGILDHKHTLMTVYMDGFHRGFFRIYCYIIGIIAFRIVDHQILVFLIVIGDFL